MKLTYKTLIIGCIIFMYSCVDNNKKEFSMNEPSMTYQKSKELALGKGDTIAYKEMSVAYMDSPNDDRFLFIALNMANKYEFKEAYLDVYYCLTDYYHKKTNMELEDLDKNTQILALDYLKKGAEKGNKECKNILGNHYLTGKYIKKDTVKGNQLIKESDIE